MNEAEAHRRDVHEGVLIGLMRAYSYMNPQNYRLLVSHWLREARSEGFEPMEVGMRMECFDDMPAKEIILAELRAVIVDGKTWK